MKLLLIYCKFSVKFILQFCNNIYFLREIMNNSDDGKQRGHKMDWQTMIFQFLGGLGLFLFAIKFMGDGLQKVAGDRLREVIDKYTTNPLIGILVGVVVTVCIQSSTATTVITVGLVSAGFMTLRQSIGVIMGANIGTTVKAFIFGFDESLFAYPVMVIGAIMFFFIRGNKIQNFGQVLFGFASIFVGLDMMTNAMQPLQDSNGFTELAISFANYPILGVIGGTIFTFIVQSSSATVEVLQGLFEQKLIPLEGALPVLFGENIGTTFTAVLASIGATVSARRAAASHVLFNVIGTAIFMILLPVFINYIEWFSNIFKLEDKMQIAFAHSTFNIINAFILLPFMGIIVTILTKLIPGEDTTIEYAPKNLDKSLIEQSSSIALSQVKEEVVHMGEFAVKGLQESMEFLFTGDQKHANMSVQLEDTINHLDRVTTSYLVELSKESLSEHDSKLHFSLFQNIHDIERIGDHFENVVELIQTCEFTQVNFSEVANQEIRKMFELVLDTVSLAVMALDKQRKDFAREVLAKEDQIDELEVVLRNQHIIRLNNGQCSGSLGILYADIISNLERIGDHASNIAETILEENLTT